MVIKEHRDGRVRRQKPLKFDESGKEGSITRNNIYDALRG